MAGLSLPLFPFSFCSLNTSKFSSPSSFGMRKNGEKDNNAQIYPTQIGIRRYGSSLFIKSPGSLELIIRKNLYSVVTGYQSKTPQTISHRPKKEPKRLILSFPNVIAVLEWKVERNIVTVYYHFDLCDATINRISLVILLILLLS